MFWTPANFFWEQPFTPKAGLMPHYTAWSGGIAVLPDGNSLINTWLQPGVSRAKRRRAVSTACRLHKKPLKRFPASTRHDTGLKPGVNEKQIIQTASEQFCAILIRQTVSGEFPTPISATPLRKFGIYATVSRKSEIDFAPRTLESEIEKMRRLLESPVCRLRQ